MNLRWRAGASGAAGLALAASAVGTSLGAVDVVELTAQQVVPGSAVTLRVATTATEVRGDSGVLVMLPIGTVFDSGPESQACEKVGGAVVVGQIHWTAGTVEYEGETYPGVTTELTFTVPELASGTYWLAESIDAVGTGCHAFTTIDVVSKLPDTAMLPPARLAAGGPAVGVGLLVFALGVSRWSQRRGSAAAHPPGSERPAAASLMLLGIRRH